jgi:hypothetical protein
MSGKSSAPVTPRVKPRWYVPTPGKLMVGVLVLQVILFLSARYRWFGFNELKGHTVLITVAVTASALLLMFVWMAVGRLFRWNVQFTLATLLWTVLVVALPCGWLAREMELARRQKRIVDSLGVNRLNTWNLGSYRETYPCSRYHGV